MRVLIASIFYYLVFVTSVGAEISSRPVTVMVNDAVGSPVSTGTVVQDGDGIRVVVPKRLISVDGLCIKFNTDGVCYSVTEKSVLNGIELAVASVDVSLDDLQKVFTELVMSGHGAPDWGIIDADQLLDAELTWIGRDSFADWREPLRPAMATSTSELGFIFAHDELGPLDEGAAVNDPATGLVGIIATADSGRAAVISGNVVFDALLLQELEIPQDRLPRVRSSELPPAAEAEVGAFWVLFHYPSLPEGLTAFYGPGPSIGHLGWGNNFDTSVLYRTYSLDAYIRDGVSSPEFLSGSDTQQTFAGTGWNLNAPYAESAPQVLATCIIHAIPSVPSRRVYNLTFWRQRADTAFEQVSFPQKGWANDDNACLTAFSSLAQGGIPGIATDIPAEVETVTNQPPEADAFVLSDDPVSVLPSAVAEIGSLTVGVTCGPGGQPVIFYRVASTSEPTIAVDIHRANLEEWTTWQSEDGITFHSPMHPQAARGTIYGAGMIVTFEGQRTILMGGNTSEAAKTALAGCE